MKFPEYKGLDLAQVNKEVLAQWKEEGAFAQALKLREGCPSFVFYEGPPSANGMPGIHHVMARAIKDTFCRYKTLKGYLVQRKAGWDTHGLPVELGVEKMLGITKEDIGKKISVDDYNAACRREVMKYTREWENLTEQIGYWVDMQNPYITYDNRYIETLWYLLKQLYEKNLLYKGYTIQPYSPAAGTGLSTHELNQPGCYRDVKDTTCVAMFKIIDTGQLTIDSCPHYFLAWTTTPWTLPSNTALCVGPAIEYCLVKTENPYSGEACVVVLAKDLMPIFFGEKKITAFEVLKTCTGKDLEGMQYEPLIPWVKPDGKAFRVITGDFVTTDDGTGIVHIAPTFGADDDRVAKQHGIAPLLLVDKNGVRQPMVDKTGKLFRLDDLDEAFVQSSVNVELYREYAGRYVKKEYAEFFGDANTDDLNVDLCLMLKQQGKVFKIEKHVHSYPHCWRTDKPVLYYPLDSWFIRSTACKERMVDINRTIGWKPESTGTGRFGKWLEDLKDWNLSRSRYWGTPLPIWRTDDGTEEKCVGSVEELKREIDISVSLGLMKANPYAGFRVGDMSADNYSTIELHRPYVDDIILASSTGKAMRREADLIDVWFDSGAMPFAQLHYPFENREQVEQGGFYPADFISEGVDQTRGWFFTLHAISTMVADSVAFKNVISTGLVLDKNGNKMSKRLGNAVEPFKVINDYGADALRWYMLTNSQPWDNLKFDIEGVDEVRRKFFGTLYNTYSFFALYANVDSFAPQPNETLPQRGLAQIDRWIISLLNTLVREVGQSYEDYEPTRAGRLIQDFVCDNLSNWYVRLNRKRFWGGEMNDDKRAAYLTLYTCLRTVCVLASPIAPFITDRIYRDLCGASVHLADFPAADTARIDADLEQKMQTAQQVTSMILALRRKADIKVRQPLAKAIIPIADRQMTALFTDEITAIIRSETNVKDLALVSDDEGVICKKAKANFKTLGAKCGQNMKEVAAKIAAFSQHEIAVLEHEKRLALTLASGDTVELLPENVDIATEDVPGSLSLSDGGITLALDITVTPALRLEGVARELVNRIQNLRKESGFNVTDKIGITLQRTDEVAAAVAAHGDYIKSQVLGVRLDLSDSIAGSAVIEIDEVALGVELKVEK